MPSCEKIPVKVSTLHSATTFSAAILEKRLEKASFWRKISVENCQGWSVCPRLTITFIQSPLVVGLARRNVFWTSRHLVTRLVPPVAGVSGTSLQPHHHVLAQVHYHLTISSKQSHTTKPLMCFCSTSLRLFIHLLAYMYARFGLCHRTPPRRSGTDLKTLLHFEPLAPRMVDVAWLFLFTRSPFEYQAQTWNTFS